ncbi:MAG: glycosyltransferase family 39 protein [Chloroflexota bacterium]
MDRFLPLNNAARQRLYPLLPLAIILIAAYLRFDHLGSGEPLLRLASALAGVLTVACAYALGRTLFARGVGWIAALLVAVSPINVYISQQPSNAETMTLLATASMLIFVRWTARPRWQLALILAVINAAGLYIRFGYALMILIQGLLFVLLWVRQRDIRVLQLYIAFNVLTLILFIPPLGTALSHAPSWYGGNVGATPRFIVQWLVYGSDKIGWGGYVWPALFGLVALLPDWLALAQPSWWRRVTPVLWFGILLVMILVFNIGLTIILPAEVAMALLIGRGVWLLWEIGSPNMLIIILATRH